MLTRSRARSAAGKLQGGAGDKPPGHPWRMECVHRLYAAAIVRATAGVRTGWKRPAVPTVSSGGLRTERFQCSSCESFYIHEVDLHSHVRRCHVHPSWRCRMEEARRRPTPSVPERCAFKKRLSGRGSSVVSTQEQEQEQRADEAAAPEVPARPVVVFPFDLNLPAPEVEEENGSSG